MTYRMCDLCKNKVYFSEPYIVMETWLGTEVTRKSGHVKCIKEEMNG